MDKAEAEVTTGMAMSIPHNLPASFWDVAPSLIREPYREMEQAVPVAVIGSPGGEVRFESVNPGIARVEDGVLRFGATPGATIIVAEAIRDEVVSSRRYIQVDVEKPKDTAVLDWRPSAMWSFCRTEPGISTISPVGMTNQAAISA